MPRFSLKTEELTWNVIFVPGTVRLLEPFLRSLLDWSHHCRFRLVSNGCASAEVEQLDRLVKRNPRLSLFPATDKLIDHGLVLNQLFAKERSPWFAFLDSDVFATGPFLAPFQSALSESCAVFSCPPIWGDDDLRVMPRGFQCLSGVYGHLWNGRVSGWSYCAIYDRARLHACQQEYGLDLRVMHWRQLPPRVRQLFRQHDSQVGLYDTAKAVNLLLGIEGESLAMLPGGPLVHLGGVSSVAKMARPPATRISKLRTWHAALPAVMRSLLAACGIHAGWRAVASGEELIFDEVKRLRRLSTCAHLSRVIAAHLDHAPSPPPFQHADPHLVEIVNETAGRLRRLIDQYSASSATVAVPLRKAA